MVDNNKGQSTFCHVVQSQERNQSTYKNRPNYTYIDSLGIFTKNYSLFFASYILTIYVYWRVCINKLVIFNWLLFNCTHTRVTIFKPDNGPGPVQRDLI